MFRSRVSSRSVVTLGCALLLGCAVPAEPVELGELTEEEFDPRWVEAECRYLAECGDPLGDDPTRCAQRIVELLEAGRESLLLYAPEAEYSPEQAAACLSMVGQFPPRCPSELWWGTSPTGVCFYLEWYDESSWINPACYLIEGGCI